MAEKSNKKSNFSIKRLIYNDKYLIIFSLVLAVLIWIVTSLNIGTDETKTVKVDVPIALGDEVSEQLGMQYYSLQDTIQVSVTVSGAKFVVGQVTQNDLSVKFDTSSVNRTGEQTIPILVTNASNNLDFDIMSTYPSSIEAYFDVNETKTFDLYLKYDENNVAEGYTFGDPVLSEDKIIISGPKTYVDKIERAAVNVDFGADVDLTEPYNIDCNIDLEGIGVEKSYLTATSRTDTETPIKTVSVTLPVLKITKLPVSVNFEDKPSGLPDDAISVEYSVDTLNAGVLDSANINNAVIGTISFDDLKVGENQFNFDITNLQGITVIDKSIKKIAVTVTVSSDYTTQTVSVNKQKVVVEGVPKGYKATVKSIDSTRINAVVLSGTSVSSDDVVLKCDVSEQNDNNKYVINAQIANNNSWVYGKYVATIELTKE